MNEEVNETPPVGRIVTIWTLNSRETLRFNAVLDFVVLSSTIEFSYFGLTTGTRNEIVIDRSNVFAYAIEVEEM